jgi:hypothetical protein
VKGNGLYKILDSSNKPNTVGWEILDRVASNNLTGARVLLDWIRDVQHVAGGDDPWRGRRSLACGQSAKKEMLAK